MKCPVCGKLMILVSSMINIVECPACQWKEVDWGEEE